MYNANEVNTLLSKRIGMLKFRNQAISLGHRTLIMGVVNVTPDSFSDGGQFLNPDNAITRIKTLLKSGADIIDIGGESTRPFSKPTTVKEELDRIMPVMQKIKAENINAIISIDTRKAEVAQEALKEGAHIINDISGLNFDQNMAGVIKEYDAGVIIMHSQGIPETMQSNPYYEDLINNILYSLEMSVKKALHLGISRDSIIIDPGIGFGKTLKHNLLVIKNLEKLKVLNFPIAIGVSRKAFIGEILKEKVENRLIGTIAASVMCIVNGANIIRTHDVNEIKQAIKISDAILNIEG